MTSIVPLVYRVMMVFKGFDVPRRLKISLLLYRQKIDDLAWVRWVRL